MYIFQTIYEQKIYEYFASFLNVLIMFILIEINMINSPYIALRENWLICHDYN